MNKRNPKYNHTFSITGTFQTLKKSYVPAVLCDISLKINNKKTHKEILQSCENNAVPGNIDQFKRYKHKQFLCI